MTINQIFCETAPAVATYQSKIVLCAITRAYLLTEPDGPIKFQAVLILNACDWPENINPCPVRRSVVSSTLVNAESQAVRLAVIAADRWHKYLQATCRDQPKQSANRKESSVLPAPENHPAAND